MGKRKEYSIQNPRLKDFTDRFRLLVDDQGGVSKVSEKTGISRPTINFWYNGQRTPDAESLTILSAKFGVSVDYLLGLSDIPSRNEDMQVTAKTTGLANTAIAALRNMKNAPCVEIGVLNELLSTASFWRLLLSIALLKAEIKETKSLPPDKKRDAFSAYFSELRLFYLNIVESLPAIIDEICNYHEYIKELEAESLEQLKVDILNPAPGSLAEAIMNEIWQGNPYIEL